MELPSNSNAAKESATRRTEKVVVGKVTRREKSLTRRFTETFIGGDPKQVVQGVLMEVLIPAARDMVVDAMNQAVERYFYGDTRTGRGRSSSRPSGTGGVISYNRFFTGGTAQRTADPRTNTANRSAHDLTDIVVPTRAEAESVIDRMFEITSRYDQATVADLYDALGLNIEPIDNKWGWTSMEGSNCKRVQNGYLLILPVTQPIK